MWEMRRIRLDRIGAPAALVDPAIGAVRVARGLGQRRHQALGSTAEKAWRLGARNARRSRTDDRIDGS